MIQLHSEFLRAGSDVLQGFTFAGSDSTLEQKGSRYTSEEINQAGVELVKKVAAEGDALTAGSISRSWGYGKKGKAEVQEEFRKQAKIFVENNIDFIICEVSNIQPKTHQKIIIYYYLANSSLITLKKLNGRLQFVRSLISQLPLQWLLARKEIGETSQPQIVP